MLDSRRIVIIVSRLTIPLCLHLLNLRLRLRLRLSTRPSKKWNLLLLHVLQLFFRVRVVLARDRQNVQPEAASWRLSDEVVLRIGNF